jgi:hypothetical protein
MPLSSLNKLQKQKITEKIVDTFSNFILIIAQSLLLYKEVEEGEMSVLKDCFPVKFLGIKSIQTTEAEIKSIMVSQLKKLKSGYDETRNNILKACSSVISYLLNDICNHSL